jgi:hypothetical protein
VCKDPIKHKDYYAWCEVAGPEMKATEKIINDLYAESYSQGKKVFTRIDVIYPDEIGKNSRDAKVNLYHKDVLSRFITQLA